MPGQQLRNFTRSVSFFKSLGQFKLGKEKECFSTQIPLRKSTSPEAGVAAQQASQSPFYFETGYALFAKRPPRPFPPPFLSPPSRSFSDPLSTHDQSRDRRPYVNGEIIRGITNGDDAILAEENFVGANDGVGAWASREKGNAA